MADPIAGVLSAVGGAAKKAVNNAVIGGQDVDIDPAELLRASTRMETTVPAAMGATANMLHDGAMRHLTDKVFAPQSAHWYERVRSPQQYADAAYRKGLLREFSLNPRSAGFSYGFKDAPHYGSKLQEGAHYVAQKWAESVPEREMARQYVASRAPQIAGGVLKAALPFHAVSSAGEAAYQGLHTPTEQYEQQTGLEGVPARAAGVMQDFGNALTFGGAGWVGKKVAGAIR